jgi:hypothetical protein
VDLSQVAAPLLGLDLYQRSDLRGWMSALRVTSRQRSIVVAFRPERTSNRIYEYNGLSFLGCSASRGAARRRREISRRSTRNAFAIGVQMKRESPGLFSPGAPELSLILGSRPYDGVSGDGVTYSQHEQQQHHCRGMGLLSGSPNSDV